MARTVTTTGKRKLLQNHLPVQLPLALSDDSEPEPDLAVVVGGPDDYWDAHPQSAGLVIEVAELLPRLST